MLLYASYRDAIKKKSLYFLFIDSTRPYIIIKNKEKALKSFEIKIPVGTCVLTQGKRPNFSKIPPTTTPTATKNRHRDRIPTRTEIRFFK